MITRTITGGKQAVLEEIDRLIDAHTIDPNIITDVYSKRTAIEYRAIVKGLRLARGAVVDTVDLEPGGE